MLAPQPTCIDENKDHHEKFATSQNDQKLEEQLHACVPNAEEITKLTVVNCDVLMDVDNPIPLLCTFAVASANAFSLKKLMVNISLPTFSNESIPILCLSHLPPRCRVQISKFRCRTLYFTALREAP